MTLKCMQETLKKTSISNFLTNNCSSQTPGERFWPRLHKNLYWARSLNNQSFYLPKDNGRTDYEREVYTVTKEGIRWSFIITD